MKLFKTAVVVLILMFFSTLNAYASDCSEVQPGGDLTITTTCSFSGTVNGVDSGSGTVNTARIILAPGGRLIINPGQKIVTGTLSFSGGSITFGGTLITNTPLWMTDGDSDGYPADTIQYYGPQPLNGKRRNTFNNITVPDLNDNQYCPDNYFPQTACRICGQGAESMQSPGPDLNNRCQSDLYQCNATGTCEYAARRVFITSEEFQGDIEGIYEADEICRESAEEANLNGDWKAWLSDSNTSASERLFHSLTPYSLINKTTKIADDWIQLTGGVLSEAINIDEFGNTVYGSNPVWTNTDGSGEIYTSDKFDACKDWSIKADGHRGRIGYNDKFNTIGWTDSEFQNCKEKARLYCFEQ